MRQSDEQWNQVVLDLPEAEYVTVIFQYEGMVVLGQLMTWRKPAEPNFVTADPNNAWGG